MRLSLTFTGRVQGVGFRATAHAVVHQQRKPLTGWVRNRHDGSVEMELQGDADTIDNTVADLQRAMQHRIRHVTRGVIADLPGESGFVIAPTSG